MSRKESRIALAALRTIKSTMMNRKINVISASAMLEKLRLKCLQDGVSFVKLLEKEVDGYGMPPLAIEASRCDLEGAADLLFFLVEHTASDKKMKYIKQGCMLRRDNLFEKLQSMLGPSTNPDATQALEYVVSSEQYATPYTNVVPDKRPPNTFRALIYIPNFAIALQRSATTLDITQQQASTRSHRSVESGPMGVTGLVLELVALGRYWTLAVGWNRLALSLMDGKECSVDASLSVIENPRAPKPKNISPSALPSAPIPPAPVSRGCSRPPDFEKSFSAAKPQTAPIIATTSADSTFDKPASTYVDLIKWAISRSPDNRATVVDICKQVAQQYPYYNDNTHFATLKSGVRQHLSQKPYFKFIVDQEGKRRGWTCDDLLTNKDIDGEAAHKGEHLVQGTDESELAATLASVDIDEAKGGPSSETKLKTSSGHPMIPAPNPSPPAKEAKPAVSTGTPGVFFFPPTTLYPQETRQRVRAHYVEIPRCFPSNSKPSSFMDVTLQSHQLLVQLVVRLYDEQDGPEMLDPSIHVKLSSSIGATGPGSSFMGSSVANRNNAESSSTGDWSVVHDDDMFDMDGTEKGGGDSDGDSTEED